MLDAKRFWHPDVKVDVNTFWFQIQMLRKTFTTAAPATGSISCSSARTLTARTMWSDSDLLSRTPASFYFDMCQQECEFDHLATVSKTLRTSVHLLSHMKKETIFISHTSYLLYCFQCLQCYIFRKIFDQERCCNHNPNQHSFGWS